MLLMSNRAKEANSDFILINVPLQLTLNSNLNATWDRLIFV